VKQIFYPERRRVIKVEMKIKEIKTCSLQKTEQGSIRFAEYMAKMEEM
jgi:hypothetical protein